MTQPKAQTLIALNIVRAMQAARRSSDTERYQRLANFAAKRYGVTVYHNPISFVREPQPKRLLRIV